MGEARAQGLDAPMAGRNSSASGWYVAIRMGADVDTPVGKEPGLPTLVFFFLQSGRKACENGTHIGMKKFPEETLLSCFLLQVGPLGTDRKVVSGLKH